MTIGAKLVRLDGAPAAYGSNDGSRCELPPMAEGESLLLRPRYSSALVTAASAPSPTAWEGPYIRLYSSVNFNNLRGAVSRVWNGETISDAENDPVTLPQQTGVYYEFDAINCPLITAPFDVQAELYTDLSGTWLFDWILFARPRDYVVEGVGLGADGNPKLIKYPARNGGQPNARLFPQTRLVYGLDDENQPNTRTLDVPLGCVEIEAIGTADTTSAPILQMTETNQSALGSLTRYPMYDANSLNMGLGRRCGVGGVRKVIISAGGAGRGVEVSGVTFWCAL